jgi:hypothetical protein
MNQLRAERDQLQASIEDLNKRGAKMKIIGCGPQSRLCVLVDRAAGNFGVAGNKDDVYMIVKGYWPSVSEPTRDRPWQIMLTGHGLDQIDAGTRQALEQILELFTEVPGLVVHTVDGRVSVTRDFPSDYTA